MSQIISIPFEHFVSKPDEYIIDILKLLDIKKTCFTENILIEQRVPRDKIADGIELDIYKRCGWTKPIENLTEADELIIRKKWVEEQVSNENYALFTSLCDAYEEETWKP